MTRFIIGPTSAEEEITQKIVQTRNCVICGGWGFLHPLKTNDTWKGAGGVSPVLVLAPSVAQHEPGDIECPFCNGSGDYTEIKTKYGGEYLYVWEYFGE